jgi:hypothetical protein
VNMIPLHAIHALHLRREPDGKARHDSVEPWEAGTLLLAAVLRARSRHPNLGRLFSLAAGVLHAGLLLWMLMMKPWETPS